MPIQVSGKLIPRNDNTWPVVDDAHIEGGYRVVADLLARNAIDVTTLKVGAAVHVVASQATYRVASIVEGVVTWEDFFPAASGDSEAFDDSAVTVASNYFACTDSGLEAKIIGSARLLGSSLTWSRSGTVMTIQHLGHTRSVGERAIVRGTNAPQVVGEILSTALDSFTLTCLDTGPVGGNKASYSMGVTWKHFRADGVTPALGLEANMVRVGRSFIPADAGIVVNSMRLRFAPNLRETTTYSYELNGTQDNGFGDNTDWVTKHVPAVFCRSELNSLSAAAITINANVDGIPQRFNSTAMPGTAVGCFLQLQF